MLTAENIQNQQFHVRFRGFDVDEVDAFLEKVAENYTLLVAENKKMAEKLDEIQGHQAEKQSQEETFKNAIISAQTIADEMKKKAEKEGEESIAQAREKADAIVNEANSKITGLEEDIAALEGEKERIKDELRLFLTTQLGSLNNDTPPPANPLTPSPTTGTTEEEHPPVAAEEEDNIPPAQAVVDEEIPEFEARDDDLSDLYEKIELPDNLADELSQPEAEQPANPPTEGLDDLSDLATDLLNTDELAATPTIPDLDDDMLFTLEDTPLDGEEPAVVVEPLPKKDDH